MALDEDEQPLLQDGVYFSSTALFPPCSGWQGGVELGAKGTLPGCSGTW